MDPLFAKKVSANVTRRHQMAGETEKIGTSIKDMVV